MTKEELILEIKQNVFQNNTQLITGINLQTTLIDMVNFFYDNAEGDKLPARYTTTSNITLSGLGTQGNGDWPSALTVNNRILVKNQTIGSENGIYLAKSGSWVRADDFNADAEVISGVLVVVTEGTDLADSLWELSTDDPIVIDTTSLVFIRIGGEEGGGIRYFVPVGKTVNNKVDFHYLVYGDLTIAGDFINEGHVVIMNGGLVLEGAGTFNNVGDGTLTMVNLQTGIANKFVTDFTTVANVPLVINHPLGTEDFVFTVRQGSTLIDVQLEIIDGTSIQITTVNAVTGRIVMLATN